MSEHSILAHETKYVTFELGGHFFGIEAVKVQEVLQSSDITPVPLADASIEGLMNLRGQLVPAISLRRYLGLADNESSSTPAGVVIRTDFGAVDFLVDLVGDVIDLDSSKRESAPANLPQHLRAVTDGVYRMENRLLLVLNADRIATLDAEILESQTQRYH